MQGQHSGQYRVPDGPPPKPPRRGAGGGGATPTETTPQHNPRPTIQVSLNLRDEEYRKVAVKVSNRAVYNYCAKTLEFGLILLLVVVVILVIVAGSVQA